MTTQAKDTPPPDPGEGGDTGAAKRSERRRAATWSPYLKRICFHPSAEEKDASESEDGKAAGSPTEDELASPAS